VRDEDHAGDLVLMGGPKNNNLTREAMDRLAGWLPVVMRTKGEEVLFVKDDFGTEVELPPASPTSPGAGRQGFDYGLVVRSVNCFDPSGTLTIFAGTHTYGTIAAAEYFLRNSRKLRRQRTDYALVVKARVTAEEHVEPAVLVHGPFPFIGLRP
jgi:hypothetical protein